MENEGCISRRKFPGSYILEVKLHEYLGPGCKARIQEQSFPESKCLSLGGWLRALSLRLDMILTFFSQVAHFQCCATAPVGLMMGGEGCPVQFLPSLSFPKPDATLK